MDKRVYLINCSTYETDLIYRKLLAAIEVLGGISKYIKPSEKVLLKPNLLVGMNPEKAINTHPSVLEAMIRIVSDIGCKCIVGDSPAVGSGISAGKKAGYKEICTKYDVPIVDFNQPQTIKTRFEDGTYKTFEIDKNVIESDKIINLAKLKTHQHMYMTLSVKNMFGAVCGQKKVQWHFRCGVDAKRFAQMLVELYYNINPVLNIVDGIIAMHKNGPNSGEPISIKTLFVGEDGIHIDKAICDLLNINPKMVPIFGCAQESNFFKHDEIIPKLIGDVDKHINIKQFVPARATNVEGLGYFPAWLSRWFKSSLTAKPGIDHSKCTKCKKCINICPANVMTLNKNVEINYRECIRCYCCQEICPEGAITAKEGFLLKILPI